MMPTDMMLWTHRQLVKTAEELPRLIIWKHESQPDYLGSVEMRADTTLLRRVNKELERRSQIDSSILSLG